MKLDRTKMSATKSRLARASGLVALYASLAACGQTSAAGIGEERQGGVSTRAGAAIGVDPAATVKSLTLPQALGRELMDPRNRGVLKLRILSVKPQVEGHQVVTVYETVVVDRVAAIDGLPYPTGARVSLVTSGGTAVVTSGPDAGRSLRTIGEDLPGPIAEGAELLLLVRNQSDRGGKQPDRLVASFESDLIRLEGGDVVWHGYREPLARVRQRLADHPLVEPSK